MLSLVVTTHSLTTHYHACVIDSIPSSMKTESNRSGLCQKRPNLPLLHLAVHLSCAASLKQCELWHRAGRTAPHHRTSRPPGFPEPLATERRASGGLPAELPVSVLSLVQHPLPVALVTYRTSGMGDGPCCERRCCYPQQEQQRRP